jgi:hypothetical protein
VRERQGKSMRVIEYVRRDRDRDTAWDIEKLSLWKRWETVTENVMESLCERERERVRERMRKTDKISKKEWMWDYIRYWVILT